MEQVLGIGGFFFVAADPDGLARWYEDHLGVARPPATYDLPPWRQAGGSTVFAPFAADGDGDGDGDGSSHLGRGGWGLNFRVRELDPMVAQLRRAGVDVEVDPETYPNGRFAQLTDPEGNAIQLWEEIP